MEQRSAIEHGEMGMQNVELIWPQKQFKMLTPGMGYAPQSLNDQQLTKSPDHHHEIKRFSRPYPQKATF